MRILRYFGMWKILLFCPTRSDQWSTGPFDVAFTSIATVMSSGDARNKRGNAIKTSNLRFVQHTVNLHRSAFRGFSFEETSD